MLLVSVCSRCVVKLRPRSAYSVESFNTLNNGQDSEDDGEEEREEKKNMKKKVKKQGAEGRTKARVEKNKKKLLFYVIFNERD
jgi:hypothetical protein